LNKCIEEEVIPKHKGVIRCKQQKPRIIPVSTFLDPLFQNKAPKKAGANCAITTNETRPMETNE
jgi:hypothetical protein